MSVGFGSSAIKACGVEGRWEEALRLLEEMQESGVRPNLITYTGGTCLPPSFVVSIGLERAAPVSCVDR